MNKFHNTEVLMTRKKILNSCVYSESNIRILSSMWLVYPLNKFSRSPFKGSHIWATFCIFMIPEKTTKKRLMCCQEIGGSKGIGITIIFLVPIIKTVQKYLKITYHLVIFLMLFLASIFIVLRLKYISYNNWMWIQITNNLWLTAWDIYLVMLQDIGIYHISNARTFFLS